MTMSNDNGSIQLECRTCLQIITKEAGFHDIFQLWNSPWSNARKKNTVAEDLTKLVDIGLKESDKHSKVICQGCCIKLYNACQFISTAKKCDEILKQRDSKDVIEAPVEFEGKLWPKPIQVDKNVNSDIIGDTANLDIKQEVLSDDEDVSDGLDNDFRPDVDIKVEPEEVETRPLKITVNGTISVDQMGKHRSIVSNGRDTFENIEFLDSAIKEEPVSDDDDQIPDDLPLECMLCSKILNSVSGLKAHVIAHHSYKSVRRKTVNSSPEKKTTTDKFTCATCRRSFVTRTDLMVHETCHNKWVCYGCNRNFDSFGQLSKHRKFCKAALQKEATKPKLLEDVMRPHPEITMEKILAYKKEDEQLEETLTCNLCSEKFSDSYYMKIHHEIHHSIEGQNENSQTSSKEISKESKDLETKALQNMFEQKNEMKNKCDGAIKQKDKDYMKIYHETHYSIDGQNEDSQTSTKDISEKSKDLETEALQNVYEMTNKCDGTRKEKDKDEEMNCEEIHADLIKDIEMQMAKYAELKNIKGVKIIKQNPHESDHAVQNNTDSVESKQKTVTREIKINFVDTEVLPEDETNQSKVDKNEHVNVSMEIVSGNNDKTYEGCINEVKLLEENASEDKLCEENTSDGKVHEESVGQNKESLSYDEVFEEIVESDVKASECVNIEVSDSLPANTLIEQEEMDIDSEI